MTGDLYTFLAATLGHDRVYPVTAPQGVTLPCLTFQRISAPRELATAGSVELVDARYQLDFWAEDLATARAQAETVRAALNGYRGTMTSTEIGRARLDADREGYEDEPPLYRVSQDYLILYKE